jgi:replicative DNA helicase
VADGPSGSSGGGGRVPPYDVGAEQAVLGGILLENDAFHHVIEIPLRAEDFYRDAHVKIFDAMIELVARGQPVDTITLREHLATANKLTQVGGEEYLLSLTNTIPTVANIEAHGRIVHEKAVVRRLIHACHEIAGRG